eukprot:8499616-Pyramimonas_sp.AAC.1
MKCGCRFWKRSPPAGTGLLGSCKGRPAPGESAAEVRRLLMRLQELRSSRPRWRGRRGSRRCSATAQAARQAQALPL